MGIGTGQVFNLAMAVAGLAMLIWALKSSREVKPPPKPPARDASWLQVAVLIAVLLYPLGIPTSWTRSNIEEKRQETVEQADGLKYAAPVYRVSAKTAGTDRNTNPNATN